ncbi:MAG: hypothetical protein VZQ49_00245 [Methanobrevibacter sp.]|nr:hypothetical protein [Methanobrevibacter sp.]
MINITKESITLTNIDPESASTNYKNLTMQIASKLASIFNWNVLANYSGTDPEVIDTRFNSSLQETMYGVSLIGLENNTYCIGVSISENNILNLFISETPRINTDVMTKYTDNDYCNSLIAINCRCGKYTLGNNVPCTLSDYSVEVTYLTEDNYIMLKLATPSTPITEYSITYDKQADCLLMFNTNYYTLWYLKETYKDETPWLLVSNSTNQESSSKSGDNSYYTWARKYNTFNLLRYSGTFKQNISNFSLKTIFQWHLINYFAIIKNNTGYNNIIEKISFGYTTLNSIPIHQLFGLFPKLELSQVCIRKLYAPLTNVESNIYLGIYSGNAISSNTTIKVNNEYFYIVKSEDSMFYAIKISQQEE